MDHRLKFLLALPLFALPAFAADPVISDTVYTSAGAAATGTIDIAPSCAFTSSDGRHIGMQNTHVVLSSGGQFTVTLVASTTAQVGQCVAVYYNAVFNLSNGIHYVQAWAVPPSNTPLTISQIWNTTYNFQPGAWLASIPLNTLASGGATDQQSLCYSISTGKWGPGNCGGGGNLGGVVTGPANSNTFASSSGSGGVVLTNGATATNLTLVTPTLPGTISSNTTGNANTATGIAGSQSPNLVYASPNGSSGVGGYRALVAADVPTLNQSTTGQAGTALALAATPTGCSGTTPIVAGVAANGNANCVTGNFAHVGGAPTLVPAYSGVKIHQVDAITHAEWTAKDQYTWVDDAGHFSFVQQACHWYVDSVNGSDSNSGLSPTTAYQTITKLNTVTLIANDSICLAAGSRWQNQMHTPNSVSGLQIYAYNPVVNGLPQTGTIPDIDVSANAANASFTLTGGCTNTYQITVSPVFGSVSGGDFVNARENDVTLPRHSLTSGCLDTVTGGAYFPSSDSGPGSHAITLYIIATDNSDVITNGKTYKYTSQEYGLNWLGITNAVVANIRCENNLGIDGCAGFGANANLYNLQAWHGNKHSIYCQSGCNGTGLLAYGTYYNSASTMIIVADTNAVSTGVSCTNCITEMPPSESAWSSLVEGFGLHAVSSGNFGVVTLTNFMAIGIGTGTAAGDATQSNFTNVYCTNTQICLAPGTSSNGNYSGGSASVNGMWVLGGNYAIQPTATGTVLVANNVHFTTSNSGAALYYVPATIAAATLTLTSSGIDAGAPWYCVEGVSTTFTLILGGSPGTGNNCGKASISYVKTLAGTAVMDYNNYLPGTSANWIVAGITYASWAALQAAGYEAHGTQP
jgi:hypothetical protein